jgi:hypothetical protein
VGKAADSAELRFTNTGQQQQQGYACFAGPPAYGIAAAGESRTFVAVMWCWETAAAVVARSNLLHTPEQKMSSEVSSQL